jgi:hypothetical protein
MNLVAGLLLVVGLVLVVGLSVWGFWPKPTPTGVLVVQHEKGAIHLINPDGSGLRVAATYPPDHWLKTAKLSPDRTRLAYAVYPEIKESEAVIRVKEVDGDRVTELATVKSLGHLFWSPDGKWLYGSSQSERPGSDDNWRLDPETGERTPLPVPGDYEAWGLTPDGGRLLCVKRVGVDGFEVVRTTLDEFRPEVVIPAAQGLKPLALFPDGKTWVVGKGGQFGTYTTGGWMAKPELKFWAMRCKHVHNAVVSPDGSRVAVNYTPLSTADGEPNMSGAGLWTYAPDGSDSRQVWKSEEWVHKFDWR